MEARDYRRRLDALKAERKLLGQQLQKELERLEDLRAEATDLDAARAMVQHAALETQGALRISLTATVTTALRAVFQDIDIAFDVRFETKRGRTEAYLEVGENGVFVNPMEAHGGGVVDIVSFALRAAFWSIAQTRPTMILDEPMKFLSRDLIPQAADMLKMVSEKLGLQIIMVTHIPEFIEGADKVFPVERSGQDSYVPLS